VFWIIVFLLVVAFLIVRASRVGHKGGLEDEDAIDRSDSDRSSPSKSTTLPDKDAWDLDAYEWDQRLPVTAELSIHYQDMKNQKSKRDITTLDFAPIEGDVMIRAYCHSRQANRTFRASRMHTVIDRETGEPVKNIVAYLSERYNKSPEGKIRNAKKAFENELAALIFVARANGRMLKKERVMIAEYLTEAVGDTIDLDFTQESLKSLNVENSQFHRALKELVNRPPEERQALIDTAVRITELPKTPDPIAVGVVQKIEKKLKAAR